MFNFVKKIIGKKENVKRITVIGEKRENKNHFAPNSKNGLKKDNHLLYAVTKNLSKHELNAYIRLRETVL